MCSFPIGIAADDLTGAADTAAVFGDRDAPVSVSLDQRPRAWEGRRAFAVTTNSRSCPPEEAYEVTHESVKALMEHGAGLIYKKIDSNLRGNVGAELAAARDAAQAPVVFAPAFPARGRATIEGAVLVEGVPVADTEMAEDPEAPVRCSDIAEVIRSQRSDLPVSHCSLAAVRAGPSALAERLRDSVILAADAETDADLDAIAQAALSIAPTPVLAGSAGLAAALARRLCRPARPRSWPAERAGPILAVLASSSHVMAAQVLEAASDGGTAGVELPCESLTRRDEPVPQLAEAMDDAGRALAAGRDTIVYAGGPLPPVERPVELVVEHLAHLAFVLVKQARPRGLLVGGGSTASGVLAALGADAIDVDDEPLPGIAAGVVVGGELDGRPVVLKPGAAGDEEAVVRLLDYLERRAAALEPAK
jgi:uncharacterized protein YgbK (DUF1537 family)